MVLKIDETRMKMIDKTVRNHECSTSRQNIVTVKTNGTKNRRDTEDTWTDVRHQDTRTDDRENT